MFKSNFSKIFRRFLLSYIIILIIPNIAGYISYQVSINTAEAASIDTSLIVLKQSKEILERRIAEVQGFTRQIALNKDIMLLMNEGVTLNKYNIYGLWKTWRDVSDFGKTNDFLQDYYIYLNNYNLILTPASVYLRPNHYYELNHYKDLTYEQWKKTMLETPQQNKILPLSKYMRDTKEYSVITYVQSLPLNSYSDPKATAVVIIDEGKISGLLKSISSKYGGWAFITDGDGNTLAASGINQNQIKALDWDAGKGQASKYIKKNHMLLISVRSDKSNWLYTAGIPEKALMEQAYTIRKITWIVTGSEMIIGLIICLLLAYRNSAPINRLMRTVHEQFVQDGSYNKNEYDFLQGNIASLISNNRLLKMELDRNVPILKDAYFKRLIRGEFNSINEIAVGASQSEIGLQGKYGYVGIIQINGYSRMGSKEILNELNAARLIIKQTIQEIDSTIHTTDLDADKIVMLFTFNAAPETLKTQDIETKLNHLSASIHTDYKIFTAISMGSVFRELSDVSRSFDEAKQTLDYSALNNSTMWYQNLVKDTAMYYYPIDLEIRLLNAIKVGEQSEAVRILEQVFELNFGERELSAEMSQQLIGELKGTLLKLLDQRVFQDTHLSKVLKNKVILVQITESIDQVHQDLKEVMDAFCLQIVNRKNEIDNNTILAVLSYLAEAYRDPDLTIYRIADKAGLPEKVISQLFKEQIGESLSDYLEKTRINKANELLFQSELTIDDIASQVGYNSSHSFRRAFKRITGVSPSMYRHTSG